MPATPEHLSVPMIFHDPKYHLGFSAEQLHIGYRIQPTIGKQPILAERFLLTPNIDLNEYDRDAVIDWLEVGFRTSGIHQAVNVGRYLRGVLRKMNSSSAAYVSGPRRQKGFMGNSFIVRIQEPSPRELKSVLSALLDNYGVEKIDGQSFSVPGIEVSVDFYPKRAAGFSDEARCLRRWRMTELLRKHVFLNPAFKEDQSDLPRFVLNEAGGVATRKLLKSAHPITDPDLAKMIAKSKMIRSSSKALQVDKHNQPPIDATYYIGKKGNEVIRKAGVYPRLSWNKPLPK